MSKSPASRALKRWRKFTDAHADLVRAAASLEVLAEHRRQVTRYDPALFALVYLSRHLAGPDGKVSLADAHAEWADSAASWASPLAEPMGDRRAEVAPREMGKSTWWFLALPLWAAAHGHVAFAAAFADTDTQAQTHLASFKSELDNNALIRADYPDLCAPKTRGRGQVEADRVSLYHARSGFVFAAAGMDSSNLGLKVGALRPDLIVLDDIEPHEGRYSSELADKRLGTLLDVIFPLNVRAHVIIAGTVTMQDSIVHRIVKHGRGEITDKNLWVGEQRIGVRHTPAIITDERGRRRSVWPEKWPLSFLESIEHTRTYAKNYANDPRGADGDYWTLDDITAARTRFGTFGLGYRVDERAPGVTRILVSVDPAVTSKRTSDYSGIAVIGWVPPPADRPSGRGSCVVLEVRQVRLGPEALRLDVLDAVERWNAGLVLVETNQGGDLWPRILWGMPVRVKTLHQDEAKEVRAADVLEHYQRGRVAHSTVAKLEDYEGQMVAFPRAPHDDMVDAAGSGIRYFLTRGARRHSKAGGAPVPYVA